MCLFFNDTATTEIYTLSLHDALPIWEVEAAGGQALAFPADVADARAVEAAADEVAAAWGRIDVWVNNAMVTVYGPISDRKSTRLNSSHANISYAVFCLKKKKKHTH